TDTLYGAASNGCDSIVTLYLTVAPILVGETEEVFLCPGATYNFSAKYPELKEAGVYTDTIQNAMGCDSVIAVEIKNVPNVSTIIRGAICQGEVYNSGVFAGLSKAGDYPSEQKTIYGCDSIVTLHLMVAQPTEAQTFEIYDTIASDQLPYVLNGLELLQKGAERGIYTRTITLGCGEATVVINVDNAEGVDDIFANTLAVTPNPVGVGQSVRVLGQFSNAEVEVITATGAVAYKQQYTTGQVILPGMPAAGIYLVRLTDNKGEYHAKLVVK
ncbi:MAG: T9SS type A sorting domain-containing protein, partial [Paludibacteraceae bacterium]|nr:T9SS type A sorting domain-containing protein [Paludibacteraceae bacterium]